MHFEKFDDGYAILGDSTSSEVFEFILKITGLLKLISTDPPYGNIVEEDWDKTKETDVAFCEWMLSWTRMWQEALLPNAAFYVWGGIGHPKFRPFLRYIVEAETDDFLLANLITWGKKRAYGVQHNYLFTREELAYFINGPDIKKPLQFNVPYLDVKRGYDGYNEKYPAKSEYLRRTNVWTDITEILRGKVHPTQKPIPVMAVPISTHTDPGDWVVDLFAGAGTTAMAARQLGRKFVVIEKKEEHFETLVRCLKGEVSLPAQPEREVSQEDLFDLASSLSE